MISSELRYNKQPISKGRTLLIGLSIRQFFLGDAIMNKSSIPNFDSTEKPTNHNFRDLAGYRRPLSQLRVIGFAGRRKSKIYWECLCDCKNICYVETSKIRSGHTQSCGCKHRDDKFKKLHGVNKTDHPLHKTYRRMIERCECKTDDSYRLYGAVGIYVCKRWRNDFSAFVEDMGPRPEGYTLDRKNNSGPYTPSNTRWATKEEQAQNTSLTVLNADLAREIQRKYDAGMSVADITRSLPIKTRRQNVERAAKRETWKNV